MKKRKPKARVELPDNDRKLLARLVGKHGRELIAAAALNVPLPKKGRPEFSNRYTTYDLVELARYLDARALVHKSTTHKHRKAAIEDLLNQPFNEGLLDPPPDEDEQQDSYPLTGLAVFIQPGHKPSPQTLGRLWSEGRRRAKKRSEHLKQSRELGRKRRD